MVAKAIVSKGPGRVDGPESRHCIAQRVQPKLIAALLVPEHHRFTIKARANDELSREAPTHLFKPRLRTIRRRVPHVGRSKSDPRKILGPREFRGVHRAEMQQPDDGRGRRRTGDTHDGNEHFEMIEIGGR
jgi:hypothetical protein